MAPQFPSRQGVWSMIAVRRLAVAGAFLSLAALLTYSDVWGEPPGPGKDLAKYHSGRGEIKPAGKVEVSLADERATTRFTDQPVLLYKPEKGEHLIAIQVKPKLAD